MIARASNSARPALDRFLFSPVDARTAAWFRIALAAAIPYFFWSRGLTWPSSAPPTVAWIYEHAIVATWYWLGIVAVCTVLAVGYRARATCALLVVGLLPMAFLSRGGASRSVLVFVILAFSFVRSDAVRWPWRPTTRVVMASTAGPSWPVRLVQIQLSVLYGVNAIAKSTPAYLRGDVLEAMSVALPNFLVDLTPGVYRLGPLVLPLAVAAVASTLTEYFLAVAFWGRRSRWVAAAIGILFHWHLTSVVRIYKLNLVSIFLYLAFLLPLTGSVPGRPTSAAGYPSS